MTRIMPFLNNKLMTKRRTSPSKISLFGLIVRSFSFGYINRHSFGYFDTKSGLVVEYRPVALKVRGSNHGWSTGSFKIDFHQQKLSSLWITYVMSNIGVPDDVAAGGREVICPENAIAKPEERGQEAALGPQI